MIPARPTTYRGIPMRSRLEARVAADFDSNGYEWLYEPRAYANETGQYLPDFQMVRWPSGDPIRLTFVEVRPNVPRAYEAMRQMTIIWDSEPDARLWIIVPAEPWLLWSADGDERTWRLYS